MVDAQVVKQLAGRIAEDTILKIGMSLNFITSVILMIVVFSHGPLFMLIGSLFLLNL